jgi:prepilin-type N-terminal cleavage/methylation domain-containing protein
MSQDKITEGFTLIELLIVIAIISILASLSFVAINPTARFQDARNARRTAEVNQILSALKLYQADHHGVLFGLLSTGASSTAYMIGLSNGNCTTACVTPDITTSATCIDLTDLVTNNGYLPSVLVDPTNGTAELTGYYIIKNNNRTITVGTCNEELGSNTTISDISVTR